MSLFTPQYEYWQKQLASRKWYRYFWIFWGIYVVIFFYAGVIFLFIPRLRVMAVLAFIAFLLARFIISEPISFLYQKQRPYQKFEFIPRTAPWLMSFNTKRPASMPSGHAAALMALTMVCYAYVPFLGTLGFIAVALNGAGRIILGYHDILDIITGCLIGILSAILVLHWIAPLLFTH